MTNNNCCVVASKGWNGVKCLGYAVLVLYSLEAQLKISHLLEIQLSVSLPTGRTRPEFYPASL